MSFGPRAVLFLCSLIATNAIVTITFQGESSSYRSSVRRYNGRQSSSVLGASLVWVAHADICDVGANAVRDRVVVTNLGFFDGVGGSACTLDEMYSRLDQAGARALIRMVWSTTPGLFSFAKTSWGKKRGKMMFVTVSRAGVLADHVALKGGAGGVPMRSFDEMTADIAEPHDETYQEIFESWLWILTMQVLLPLFAFCVSLLGANVMKQRCGGFSLNTRRPVGFYVCAISSPSTALIGCILMFGSYGPTLLPTEFHIALGFLLCGSQLFSSVILAALAREKIRVLKGLPERNVWSSYRRTISASALVFLGCDVGALFLIPFPDFVALRYRLFSVSAVLFFVGQLGIGLYFIYESNGLKIPIRHYRQRQGLGRLRNPRPIKRLSFWINTAGILTLINVVATIGIFSIMYPYLDNRPQFLNMGRSESSLWFSMAFIYSVSRIGCNYAQIKVITNKANQEIDVLCLIGRVLVESFFWGGSLSKVAIEEAEIRVVRSAFNHQSREEKRQQRRQERRALRNRDFGHQEGSSSGISMSSLSSRRTSSLNPIEEQPEAAAAGSIVDNRIQTRAEAMVALVDNEGGLADFEQEYAVRWAGHEESRKAAARDPADSVVAVDPTQKTQEYSHPAPSLITPVDRNFTASGEVPRRLPALNAPSASAAGE